LRRGFKAEAERLAEVYRSELHVQPLDQLDVEKLATHLGIAVRSADELTNVNKLQALEHLQPMAFSACSYQIGEDRTIVYNPLTSSGRRNSDIAHEIAHIVLNHSLGSIQTIGGVPFFTCDDEQEQEANWLAGCLLLPRKLLVRLAARGMSAAGIAQKYEVTESMARFRLSVTGVLRQVGT
jgi:Zn-dependent peptidase ImmA (M78 family)